MLAKTKQCSYTEFSRNCLKNCFLTLLSYFTYSPRMTQLTWQCNIHSSTLLNKCDWAILHYSTNNCLFILYFLEHFCTKGRQASWALWNSNGLISESISFSSFRVSHPFNFSLSVCSLGLSLNGYQWQVTLKTTLIYHFYSFVALNWICKKSHSYSISYYLPYITIILVRSC